MEKNLEQLSLSADIPVAASTDDSANEAAGATANDEVSKLQKRKKKKSKSKSCSSLGALAKNNSALPSQKCMEGRFPWKIVVKSGRGRCAIATRDIKAGEVIVSECALAFVLRSSFRTIACHNCCKDFSKESTSIQCRVCNYSLFCQECWESTRELHQECCSVIKLIGDIAVEEDCDKDLLRLMLFLALQRHSTMNETKDTVGIRGGIRGDILYSSFQDAMALQTHENKVSESWRLSVARACERLAEHATNEITNFQNSKGDLEYLACLINANAHGMGAQGIHNTDIAIGIFPFVSMLNHSCRPNCCFYSEGNVMHVRATKDITKNSELCLSYINLYEARGTRKEQLAVSKHFDCACSRCTEPLTSSVDRFLEGVLCNVKGCNGVLVKQPQSFANASTEQPAGLWQCDTCLGILDPTICISQGQAKSLDERPWDTLNNAQTRLSAAISVYKERRFKEARKQLEDFLSEFTGKLAQEAFNHVRQLRRICLEKATLSL
ncbi:hypothetical protein KP509_27G007700 [Ceratopteris richardii]|uniref:SET domain-containing protein n=1 Tax=Ceratopteris richardii TaxID=49495 RepID=A0A8T2RDM8_CERRI|nr:hypothetical protein KP509_27G007700 [Ceratopteris richardii]